MGSIVGQDLREYVIKQINVRQHAHGSGAYKERTLEELTYLNSRTSWVKLASGVTVTSDKLKEIGFNDVVVDAYKGQGLARNFILFNGTSQIADFGNPNSYNLLPIEYQSPIPSGYNTSPDYGIFPMAGITDVSIKSLNRGSLKKATVKLKVQDRQQLAVIDILYLRLGYTVLLEWGNSVFLDNDGNLQKVQDTILEQKNLFFDDSFAGVKYSNILTTIDNQREKYAANYDGMLAKVSNFNWTFNEDGSYDVEITLISWGDVIESLKTNVTANKNTIDFVELTNINDQENSIIQINRKENVIFSLLHTLKNLSFNSSKGPDIKIDSSTYGNFITSGSDTINVSKFKTEFQNVLELWEFGANGSSAKVNADQFRWIPVTLTPNSDIATMEKYPLTDLQIAAYYRSQLNSTEYNISTIATRGGKSNNDQYEVKDFTPSSNSNLSNIIGNQTVVPAGNVSSTTQVNNNQANQANQANFRGSNTTFDEWNDPTTQLLLPFSSYSPNKTPKLSNNLGSLGGISYTLPELYTRTNGNITITSAPVNSALYNHIQKITKNPQALQDQSKGAGYDDDFFKGKKLLLWKSNTSPLKTLSNDKNKEFTNPQIAGIEYPSSNLPSAQIINLKLNKSPITIWYKIDAPKYVWGIVGKLKDNFGNITPTGTIQEVYFGLQSKFGIDGGKLIKSPTKTISKPSTNPKLNDYQKGDSSITGLQNTEFEAFKSGSDVNPSNIFSQPQYDPSTGLPSDDNFEFFHRFVAKDEAEALNSKKPFFWKQSSKIAEIPIFNKAFSNPFKSLKFDPKGTFVLNTDPKAYYIKFGFLLYLIEEKVIFRIDEQQSEYTDNTSIIKIDYSSSAEIFCINSENTGQISYDWKTCIVRRDKFNKPWTKTNSTPATSQKVFPELDPWAEEDDPSSQQRKSIANAMNVYLNFDFVGQCFQSNTDERGNIAVYGVINSICAGINKALGGVNNLEPVIDETTNTLNIVDTTPKYNYIDQLRAIAQLRSEPYLLKLYGYSRPLEFDANILTYYPNNEFPYYESTFARKVDLKTAITPEYATMITVGAAAGSSGYVKGTEATAFAKWNFGIYDRFKPSLIPGDPDLASTGSNNIAGSGGAGSGGTGIEDTLQSYEQAMNASPQCFGLKD